MAADTVPEAPAGGTITTVEYGDYFPVTPTGQLVTVGIMIGGIALIGVVTATLASWIVEKVSEATMRSRRRRKLTSTNCSPRFEHCERRSSTAGDGLRCLAQPRNEIHEHLTRILAHR